MKKSFAELDFVKRTLAEDIDLQCLARRPTPKEIFGIVLIVISYIIGWPAVAGFGLAAVYMKEPLVLIIGGPLIYGISHLVFFAGIYIAGKEHARVLLKWSLKKVFEKMLVRRPDKAQTG